MSRAIEVNFDGLVGPTHNYAGLSWGNLASTAHAQQVSNPKAAALQGLSKMWRLAQLGIQQAVIPPQERPDISALRRLGFYGGDTPVIKTASQESPQLFQLCCSASSMWTANAATISPSTDCVDAKIHITPANLTSNYHRSIEVAQTARLLHRIFVDPDRFVHHQAIPSATDFSDEGAANTMRLCAQHGEKALAIFVYGRVAGEPSEVPSRFTARQTFEAAQTLARTHGLSPQRTLFLKQNPLAIDQGVFHNDVIAVANENVLFYHQEAYEDSDKLITKSARFLGEDVFNSIEIRRPELAVEEAVNTYLFNSQLITKTMGEMVLIAPIECERSSRVKAVIDRMIADPNPIQEVIYVDLKQSMQNGGGPACLRLRVVLNKAELAATHQKVFLDEPLYQQLGRWIERHYRDRLHPRDLADPQLLEESRTALDELTQILELESIYPFQMLDND